MLTGFFVVFCIRILSLVILAFQTTWHQFCNWWLYPNLKTLLYRSHQSLSNAGSNVEISSKPLSIVVVIPDIESQLFQRWNLKKILWKHIKRIYKKSLNKFESDSFLLLRSHQSVWSAKAYYTPAYSRFPIPGDSSSL